MRRHKYTHRPKRKELRSNWSQLVLQLGLRGQTEKAHLKNDFIVVCISKIDNFIALKGPKMLSLKVCREFGQELLFADFTTAWESEDWDGDITPPPDFSGQDANFSAEIADSDIQNENRVTN
jgi:hypothetical protein